MASWKQLIERFGERGQGFRFVRGFEARIAKEFERVFPLEKQGAPTSRRVRVIYSKTNY